MSWPEAATRDVAAIGDGRNWHPGENYGIAAKRSGLVILDLDVPKPGYMLPPEWAAEPGIRSGADVLAALAERAGQPWPCTYTARTPSGGLHLYFRAIPGRLIGNRPAGPMVDVRGGGGSNGGYVIGPGSILGGRAYEVADDQTPQALPPWIAALLDPPQARRRPIAAVPGLPPGNVYGRLRGLIEHVLAGQPGDRNGRLHWGACRAAEMVAAGDLDRQTAEAVLARAAAEAGLRGGEAEARRTIASGMRSAA